MFSKLKTTVQVTRGKQRHELRSIGKKLGSLVLMYAKTPETVSQRLQSRCTFGSEVYRLGLKFLQTMI